MSDNLLRSIRQLVFGRKKAAPVSVNHDSNQHEQIEIMEDRFITWLTLANAGMLTPGNVWCFDYAIKNLPSSNPIVEIGSFCGLSTNVINYFKMVHRRSNRLYCVDPWVFEGSDQPLGHPLFTHEDYRQFVKETFVRNVSFFNRDDLPIAIELSSKDFFLKWSNNEMGYDLLGRTNVTLGGPISFAYVDGNHTYECAREDFENVDLWLEPGGLILFDDSADGSAWEVCRVMPEVSASNSYELVRKNPNYLFKKKRS